MKRSKKTERKPWTNDDTLMLLKYKEMGDKNRKLIQEDILWDGGHFIKLDGNGKPGLLIGALEDKYDYYFIIETADLKLCISSCVGGYEVLEDIPNELSVLDWMRDHDPDGIKKRVMDQLKDYFKHGDKIMSDMFFTEDR